MLKVQSLNRATFSLLTFILGAAATLGSAVASAQVKTEMRLFSDSFISPAFEATHKTDYQFVGAQLKTEAFSEDAIRMDISGGVALGAPLLNYLNITEFYVENKTGKDETFYIGRKRMLWNELDARWDLGVWEPLFKWNPLAPKHQGLTGLYWQVDKPYYGLMLFASPIYLPDQGPSFEIENGSFVKGNPWFRRPPESMRIWSEATAIDYTFERPNEAQIVMQNSFGGKVSFGDAQSFQAQASYIYKPSNQLAIGYDGKLDVGQLKGSVNLQPQVFYHSLVGGDITYRRGALRFGVSGVYDRPTKDKIFDDQWTHPIFEDSMMISPFIEWSNDKWGWSLQQLNIYGGEVTEEGSLANPSRAPMMVRYPYRQAQQIAIMSNLGFSKDRRLVSKVSYTRSELNKFDLIRFSARLRLSGMWSLVSEAQLLKAGAATAENQNEIAQFENNDRLMIGAAYVF